MEDFGIDKYKPMIKKLLKKRVATIVVLERRIVLSINVKGESVKVDSSLSMSPQTHTPITNDSIHHPVYKRNKLS